MPSFYWRRRVYDSFSPVFDNPSELQKLSDHFFEDFCICTQDPESTLCLRTFGLRHAYPEYQILHRISHRTHFFCILSGKGYMNGQPVSAGNVILTHRNTPFNISADREDPFIYVWMTFSGNAIVEYLRILGITAGHRLYQISELDTICSLFYDILYVDHPSCDTALYLESRMISLLSRLRSMKPVYLEPLADSRQNRHVYDAVAYLSQNCFRQDFRVGEVADNLGMNEKYLRRLFLQVMHISVRDYVTDRRIQRAAELLKRSNYTVSEISEFVGYRDYRQFHAQFKAKTGKTPTDYRKE